MKTNVRWVGLVPVLLLLGCSKVEVNDAPKQEAPAAPPVVTETNPAPTEQAPVVNTPTVPFAPQTATPQAAAPTEATSGATPQTEVPVAAAPTPAGQAMAETEENTSASTPNDENDDEDPSAYQTFQNSLASDGTWSQTPQYGYVFQPTVQDPNWAPYQNGHWVYSNSGWTWVSNERWGWATYHYGRWTQLDGHWAWVPGRTWAPAWVSWRNGGGYCGWAPLPPESRHLNRRGGVNLTIGSDADSLFHIGVSAYNFIPQAAMGETNYRPHYVNRAENTTVINKTTNITNITINRTVNNYNTTNTTNTTNNIINNSRNSTTTNLTRVNVGGPSLQQINATSKKPVTRVSLVSSTQRGPAHLQGNTLAVFAPPVKTTLKPAVAPMKNHPAPAQTSGNAEQKMEHPAPTPAPLKPAEMAPTAPIQNRPAPAQTSGNAELKMEHPKARIEAPAQNHESKPMEETKSATADFHPMPTAKPSENAPVEHPAKSENSSASQKAKSEKKVVKTRANEEVKKEAEAKRAETKQTEDKTAAETKHVEAKKPEQASPVEKKQPQNP